MKIIQSFWSGGSSDVLKNGFGWLSSYYHLIGWILSVNQLKKHYERVELFTDSLGKEILIDKLKLPYTKVHVVLDELNHYDSNLWALAKIKTYELQKEPFLHVDGDVFIWEKFPREFEKSDIIVQNKEVITEYYKNMWKDLCDHLKYIPDELNTKKKAGYDFAFNMGLIGGNDIEIFKRHSKIAFDFVEKNRKVWSKINKLNFNIFFEQVLFYKISQENNRNVSTLFNEIPEDNEYLGFGDFHKVPVLKTYLHLLGDYKRNVYVLRAMEFIVIANYPKYYELLLDVLGIKEEKIGFNYDFSFNDNQRLINEFIEVIHKQRKKINEQYIFSRNLAFVGRFLIFEEYLSKEKEILLIKLPCSNFKEIKGKYLLEIKEMNLESSFLDIDELDTIILKQIGNSLTLKTLLNSLIVYLDEDIKLNPLELERFNKIVINRIRYYITKKVIFFELVS